MQEAQLQQPAPLDPGQAAGGGGRRPPPVPEPDGEVRRRGLGQLAVLVDQDDVVGLRVPERPREVDVAAGGLVLEPRAGGVHGIVVQREAHRPGAGRAAWPQLDLDLARPGTAGSGPGPARSVRATARRTDARTSARSNRKPAQSAESAMRARWRSRLRSPSPGTKARVSRSRCSVTSCARTAALACSSARSARRLRPPRDAAARPVHGRAGGAVHDDGPDGDVEPGPERARTGERPARRRRSRRPAGVGSRSPISCIVRRLGAPVTDPHGNSARNRSSSPVPAPDPRAHLRGHLPDGRVALEGEELVHHHAADLGHAAEVVAEQVDDHEVLGLLLAAGSAAGGSARGPRRSCGRAARCPSSGRVRTTSPAHSKNSSGLALATTCRPRSR